MRWKRAILLVALIQLSSGQVGVTMPVIFTSGQYSVNQIYKDDSNKFAFTCVVDPDPNLFWSIRPNPSSIRRIWPIISLFSTVSAVSERISRTSPDLTTNQLYKHWQQDYEKQELHTWNVNKIFWSTVGWNSSPVFKKIYYSLSTQWDDCKYKLYNRPAKVRDALVSDESNAVI